jgi:hypothetical protein
MFGGIADQAPKAGATTSHPVAEESTFSSLFQNSVLVSEFLKQHRKSWPERMWDVDGKTAPRSARLNKAAGRGSFEVSRFWLKSLKNKDNGFSFPCGRLSFPCARF